jgi:hypothetical protein
MWDERHTRQAEIITERLLEHPELLTQVEKLLEEVDDPHSKIANLDDAEDIIAERIHQMAKDALESWAKNKADNAPSVEGSRRAGKKTALAKHFWLACHS